jgi:hypothetical protein
MKTEFDLQNLDVRAGAGRLPKIAEPGINPVSESPTALSAATHSGDDLVWGVAAIAAVVNRTRRQTFHMLETSKLPAAKIGGRWCASRSGLRRFFSDAMTAGADT